MSVRQQYAAPASSSAAEGTEHVQHRVYPQQPVAKRVLVPTRTGGGNYSNSQNYRTSYNQTMCNAVNRLESVADEKPDIKKGFDPARIYRTADKSRGLRHFSTKVCEKVREKGRTNYNEVADELVSEYFDSLTTPPQSSDKQQYDMKNIRRRVYDALNVLMAMNIIEKEKKEIRWVGLPTSSSQECRRLEDEKQLRQESILKKTEQLQELVIQLVAYKTLVQRNRENERKEGRGPNDSMIFLPFIVVNTDKETVVDCSIANDKTEFLFHFDRPFEIHDDIEILKRLGLAYGLEKNDVPDEYREQIRNSLPTALRGYADQIIDGTLVQSLATPPPPPPPKIKLTQPVERKVVPVIRAVAPAQPRQPQQQQQPKQFAVPQQRPPAKIRPVVVTAVTGGSSQYKQVRAAGQPYAIPPSGVYRQYPMNNRPLAPQLQQRYIQRAVPRVSYTANASTNGSNEMVMPSQNEQMHYEGGMVYEDNY